MRASSNRPKVPKADINNKVDILVLKAVMAEAGMGHLAAPSKEDMVVTTNSGSLGDHSKEVAMLPTSLVMRKAMALRTRPETRTAAHREAAILMLL